MNANRNSAVSEQRRWCTECSDVWLSMV